MFPISNSPLPEAWRVRIARGRDMKAIKDTIKYLEAMDKMTDSLNPDQKKHFETIMTSVLTLLTCFKKASNLGKVAIDFGAHGKHHIEE
jgi:hypothetical protein